jgi:tetratricopeptide (TPR) repeat protein
MADWQLAWQREARAERALGYADGLCAPPSAYALGEIRATLAQALGASAALGDRHPLMDRVDAMVAQRPASVQPTLDAATQLRQLLLDMAIQAESVFQTLLFDEGVPALLGDEMSAAARPATFGQYLNEAVALCAGGGVDEAQAWQALAATSHLSGDTRELVQDLLRRLSLTLDLPPFRQAAADAHLRTLLQQAMAIAGHEPAGPPQGRIPEGAARRYSPEPTAARRSRRAADRGLAALALAPWLKGSELEADFLIARGQGLYYESNRRHAEAITCWQQALRLKRRAGNSADADRLVMWLAKQVHHWMGKAVMGGFIGIEAGASAQTLRLCVEVADDLGDAGLAASARLALSDVQHALGQHEAAEALLRELLASAPAAPLAWQARFTLASILAETGRPRAAAALQEALLADAAGQDDRTTSTLWSNYANSLRLIGDLDRAANALDHAWTGWQRAEASRPPGQHGTEFVRLKLLFAQLAQERGDLACALACVDEAQASGAVGVFGLEQVRIAELKAGTLLAAGSFEAAAEVLDAASQNLRAVLSAGHTVDSWEGLFRRWSSIDEMAVRAEVSRAVGGQGERALLRAEEVKGRVMRWLSTRDPAAAASVLSPQRQIDALARARAWLGERPGRRVVSFFAGSHGVGLFSVGAGARVETAWLDDVDYTALRETVFLPFEQAAEDALSRGDTALAQMASALMEHLLAQVGTWLWRGLPALADGGSELVLLPHRVLRALPLAQAMLPSGRRLSQLFDATWTAPSLELAFEVRAQPAVDADGAAGTIPVHAVVDADGSLPFATCEALVSAGPPPLRRAQAATTAAVLDALGSTGVALISMHGEFVPGDPFAQRILTADGELQLRDLLLQDTPVRADAVLLGVCEAGQQRRSVSDEPFGFPAMLLQGGAAAVLAPLWKVDDFASLHFMTRLMALLRDDMAVEQAATRAAQWMRSARAAEVMRATDTLMHAAQAALDATDPLRARIQARVGAQLAWLATLPRDARPFGGAIDWAAFQVTRKTFTGG